MTDNIQKAIDKYQRMADRVPDFLLIKRDAQVTADALREVQIWRHKFEYAQSDALDRRLAELFGDDDDGM